MKLRIEVVHALSHEQTTVALELESGATVADALAAACLQDPQTGKAPDGRRVGIWGLPVSPDTGLQDGDRVEIYRELVADPKQARRQRAIRARSSKARG